MFFCISSKNTESYVPVESARRSFERVITGLLKSSQVFNLVAAGIREYAGAFKTQWG